MTTNQPSPLKVLRAQHGLTQAQLGSRVGITGPAICEIERGKVLGCKTLMRVAELYGGEWLELIHPAWRTNKTGDK